MVNPIATFNYLFEWASSIFWFLYAISQRFLEVLLTGNQQTLGRLLVSLIIIYLTLSVLLRMARVIYATAVFAVRVLFVVVAVFVGLQVYINGLGPTWDLTVSFFRGLTYDNAVDFATKVVTRVATDNLQPPVQARKPNSGRKIPRSAKRSVRV